MYSFRYVTGEKVPNEALELTRGEDGCMWEWLQTSRQDMVAILVYDDETLVGWCCAVRTRFLGHYTKTVEVGTYVSTEHRRKGLGRRLMNRMAGHLRSIEPRTIVRYGAPDVDAGWFNNTYVRSIEGHGLRAVRYFSIHDEYLAETG